MNFSSYKNRQEFGISPSDTINDKSSDYHMLVSIQSENSSLLSIGGQLLSVNVESDFLRA